jgi:hypothetical protein
MDFLPLEWLMRAVGGCMVDGSKVKHTQRNGADGSYWVVTSVGPPLADGSRDGTFHHSPWSMEDTNFAVAFIGQVKPMNVSYHSSKNFRRPEASGN